MSDLKAMREELRKLRKESQKPVSRMKKADISAEIERMKVKREETPPVASTEGAKPKKMAPSVETVKMAKAKEFPVAPTESKAKSSKKSAPTEAPAPKKKDSKLKRLMKMMEAMSESEGEEE